jgi:hypothetical protein
MYIDLIEVKESNLLEDFKRARQVARLPIVVPLEGTSCSSAP